MLIDKRLYSKPKQFELQLKRKYGYKNGIARYKNFGYIQGLLNQNTTIEWKLGEYNELNFTIVKQLGDRENPFWNYIQPDHVIEVSNNIDDEKELYAIAEIRNDSKGGIATKSIKCYSLEYEFTKKKVKNVNSYGTDVKTSEVLYARTLYDIFNNEEYGILKKYMANTWTLDLNDIDSKLWDKKRTYDFPSGTLWGFLGKLQESFNCVFIFDTMNRKIKVQDLTIYPTCPKCHESQYLVYKKNKIYCTNDNCRGEDGHYWSADVYGTDTGLYLTDKNYIQSLNETQSGDVVTKLIVYGANDLTINAARDNIAGTSYIIDYSYFRNNNYFTPELTKAYDEFYNNLNEQEGKIAELLSDLTKKNNQISNLKVGKRDIRGTLDEMKNDLKNVLSNTYDNASDKASAIQDLNETYENYITQINDDNYTEFGLYSLQQLYNVLQARMDAFVALKNVDMSNSEAKSKIEAATTAVGQLQESVQTYIDKLNKNISKIETQVQTIESDLAEARNKTNIANCLSEDLYKELTSFGCEQEYTNSDISIDEDTEFGSVDYYNMVDSLYQDGINTLRRSSSPSIDIKIDIVNFLRDIKCQHDWDKLRIGDVLHVRHGDSMKSEYVLRIMKIKYCAADKSIDVELSNNDGFNSPEGVGRQIFQSITSSHNAISTNKTNWNSNTAVNKVSEIMEKGLNDVISTIRTSGDQKITYDNTGLTIESALSEYKDHAIKMTNGAIAFTTDGWKTVNTAITPHGVIGDTIFGKIIAGMNLTIQAPIYDDNGNATDNMTFKVDAEGVTINNGYLTIKSDDGHGVTLSPQEGFINTSSDDTIRVKMGADDGIRIQTKSSTEKWDEAQDVFYVTAKGEMRLDGEAWLKSLYIGSNKTNVIDLVKDKSEKNTNGASAYGKILNGKYLQVTDSDDNVTFYVDEKGNLYVGGDSVFAGNIDTNKNCRVGEHLFLTATDYINDSNPSVAWKCYDKDGTQKTVGSIFVLSNGDMRILPYNNLYIGNYKVSTFKEISDLQQQLNNVYGRLQNIEDSLHTEE